MGSIDVNIGADSPALTLTHPTDTEKQRTWRLNHAEWGGALGLEDYLRREPHLETVPLSRDGGMTHWILTTGSGPPDKRPVFSSVETLRKRALFVRVGAPAVDGERGTSSRTGDGIEEGIAYGIASVFTEPQFRGQKYASRMMRDLGTRLGQGEIGGGGQDEGKADPKPIASALWSDIGKQFYDRQGWRPFQSTHMELTIPGPSEGQANGYTNGTHEESQSVKRITYENLSSICELDERVLRRRMAALASKQGSDEPSKKRMLFAFAPDHDILRWHLERDDCIGSFLFSDKKAEETTMETKGAIAGENGRRVWALWARNYIGDKTTPEKNKLYILRLGMELVEEGKDIQDLVAAFKTVMEIAREQAQRWGLGKIELWNPDPLVNKLLHGSEMSWELVEREKDSIPSLQWHGSEDTNEVEWITNEKYCWC